MRGFVYRAEAKGIQAWILASDRLRELKGGSALIDGLAEDAHALFRRVGARGTLVSAAAGAVEVHFDAASDLARFAEAWPLVVEARAPGLTLVQAWTPAALREDLFSRLGADRNRRHAEFPEAGPLAARSARTGLPAVRRGENGMEDRIVRAKLAAAQGRGLDGLLPRDDLHFCDDAEQLGESYLAVVHADGNGVGALFQNVDDAGARRALSENLTAATRAAAKRAVAALVAWMETDDAARGRRPVIRHDGKLLVRARPVVLGGDDLTFLVDAAFALPFTRLFLVAFEDETRRFETPLTACAGVAFVKTGFPFHAAHDLAESLCKAAKSGLRGADGRTGRSGLLFHRVTTASTDTEWSDIVEGELTNRDRDRLLCLSAGPYDLERLSALAELTARTREMPRTALRTWLTLVRTDPSHADAHWRRAQEVAGTDTSAWKGFAAALEALGHDPGDASTARTAGWERSARTGSGAGPAFHTALADALAWRTLQPDDADRLRLQHPSGRTP